MRVEFRQASRMIACFIGVNVGSGHSAYPQAITRDK